MTERQTRWCHCLLSDRLSAHLDKLEVIAKAVSTQEWRMLRRLSINDDLVDFVEICDPGRVLAWIARDRKLITSYRLAEGIWEANHKKRDTPIGEFYRATYLALYDVLRDAAESWGLIK